MADPTQNRKCVRLKPDLLWSDNVHRGQVVKHAGQGAGVELDAQNERT
jgi:hypothetical protein